MATIVNTFKAESATPAKLSVNKLISNANVSTFMQHARSAGALNMETERPAFSGQPG